MYVTNYIGQDASAAQEFLRISQAFEESELAARKMVVNMTASSSKIIRMRAEFGANRLYLAVVALMKLDSSQFTAYMLRVPAIDTVPALTSFANNGTLYQLSIDGSGNLQAVNNAAGTRVMGVNLIQLL